MTIIFYPSQVFRFRGIGLLFYFFLCTSLHGVLDARTSGGLGIAFFSLWDNTHYFLPWTPIKVSPIGINNFFGEWGWVVIKSELLWIGIPCAAILILITTVRKSTKPK